jgi:aminoglycoside 6'-N-acetyltransferase I
MIMTFHIRTPKQEDWSEWLRLRRALWEDCPDERQKQEIDEILGSDTEEAFFAERAGGGLCGMVEASIRPCADGCESRPVGYVEGWYVDPDARRQGVGRALVATAESWARLKGCREMASDAHLWNAVSHQAHEALGFVETERLVHFKKDLL